jgi:NAD(P)H-flavin reductase
MAGQTPSIEVTEDEFDLMQASASRQGALMPDPILPQLAYVRRRQCDGPQVWTLDIDAQALFGTSWVPGQFNMLTAFGIGEIPISFSGDPTEGSRLVHTIRAVGPVSRALTQLQKGDRLGIRGPYGIGWPMTELSGHDVLIMAGGLGLAPLRPVLYQLFAERGRYGQIALLYGTRSPKDILFRRELETWRRRLDIDLEVTVDHAMGDWHGHVGVITSLIGYAAFDPSHTVALLCGPEVMMRLSAAALCAAGLTETSIYLSLERNMQCALGFCGHCQLGSVFVCRDGPVFRFDRLRTLLALKEI